MHEPAFQFPEYIFIDTPRLTVRAATAADAKIVNAAVVETFEDLTRWEAWANRVPNVEDTRANLTLAEASRRMGQEVRLLAFIKASGELAVSAHISLVRPDVPGFDVGYFCKKSAQGQGYTTEVATALVRYCFDTLGANRVEMTCDVNNHASERVMQKAGLQREGLLKNHARTPQGALRDTLLYAATR